MTGALVGLGNDRVQLGLREQFIEERNALGQRLVENDAPDRGFDELAFHTHFNLRVQMGFSVVVCDKSFFGAGENLAFALNALALLG